MSAGTVVSRTRRRPSTDLSKLRTHVPVTGVFVTPPEQIAAVFALCSRMPGDNSIVLEALGLIPTVQGVRVSKSHKKESK